MKIIERVYLGHPVNYDLNILIRSIYDKDINPGSFLPAFYDLSRGPCDKRCSNRASFVVFCSGTGAVSIYGSVLHSLCLRRDVSWLMQPFTVVFRFCGLSADGWYVLLTGLLCGCPMGAKTCADFLAEGGSAPARQSFSSPSVITRVPCFSQVSFIPCLPLSYRFCALSLPFTCRSCCSLSRHTSFITLLLVLNPSRKISVFPNNIQLRIPPMRFLQSTHDQINRPVLHFPWMPRS